MEKDKEFNISKEQVLTIIKEIEEKTAKNEYHITINYNRTPGLFDDKFGGLPYWDLSKEYPRDENGDSLVLLAQINLDGLERLNNSDGIELPQKGMLQFFHAVNDLYGFDFDADTGCDLKNNKGYKVVYHETVDTSVTEEQIRALNIDTTEDVEKQFTPIEKTSAIDLHIEKTSLGMSDYRWNKLFLQLLKEKFGIVVPEECCMYYILDDDIYEMLDEMEEERQEKKEEFGKYQHHMMGYADFTQFDPREGNKKLQKYDVVLLQIDSDYNNENSTCILWGDCGIGNFFINHEHLKNKNFNDILYNWDCC